MTRIEGTTRAQERTVEQVVHELVGDVELRPGQADAIEAVLQRDTLAVLATGLGKSLVYQAASRLIPGGCLVVSPTLSLQADQLDNLRQHGWAAAVLNGDLTPRQHRAVLADWGSGALDVLLLAPEQLARADVLDTLAEAGVGVL